MRVLRLSHSGVVDAWRERERVVREHGHKVRSVTAMTWDEGGIDVPLAPRPGEDVVGVRTWGRHPALFVYDPVALWRLLGEQWDVLDIHEEPFALATAEVLLLRRLRRRRVPYLLYTAQNLDKTYPPPFRWTERWALRHASAVSACNAESAAIVRRKGLAGQAHVIGLGVDTSVFHPGPTRQREGDHVLVGYAGRLARHKGLDVLLDAVASTPRLRLRLAGAGPSEADARARISRPPLRGRAELMGPLGQRGLADLYREVDVLAVPSLTTRSWVEQFGRVAIEAMACGTPVVASASGALPDVVGGAGVLVPPGDADALAAGLLDAGTDRRRSGTLSAEGIARARAYDWETIGERYVQVYKEVAHAAVPDEARGVEVVVVAYHHADLLRQTLKPVAALPVTVVDNSSDPAVRAVCAEVGVRYLDPGRNGGFAAGVNHGLDHRLLPGADVLLLNPDAVVDAHGIAALHRALLAEPDLASVAPSQVDGAGRPSRVAWPLPSPAGTVLEALGLGRLRRDAYVIGSVLMLRSEALGQVGPLDESFFLYAEETDWAARAHAIGWRHALVPEVTATHLGSATSAGSGRRDAHFHASQERYHRKHFGASGWGVTRAATVAGAAVRAVVLRGVRRQEAQDRLLQYLRGPVAVERALLAQELGHP